ncbi:hypothetical protein V8G54_007496 [Vigna mungo]|uniref:Uncharacterized protein n=1 Tax=Vigna mungo TaxID=3915 RepID=A0AAQ3P1R1_VIGMU
MTSIEASPSSFSKKAKSSAFLIKGLKISGPALFPLPLINAKASLNNRENTNPDKVPASAPAKNPRIHPRSFLLVCLCLRWLGEGPGADAGETLEPWEFLLLGTGAGEGASPSSERKRLERTGSDEEWREGSRKLLPEKLNWRRLRKERTEEGTLPVKRLSATERVSRLGKYLRKLRLPENWLEDMSNARRRVREESSEGTSPEKRLLERSRISSLRQSTIWGGRRSTRWLSERRSCLSSVRRPIAGDKTPLRCFDLKTNLVIRRT